MAMPHDRFPAPIEDSFALEAPSSTFDGRDQLSQLQFGVYDQYADYQKKMTNSTVRGRRRASLSGAPTAADFRDARLERRASASHESPLTEVAEELTPLSRSRKAYSETNLMSVGLGGPPTGWPGFGGASHAQSMVELHVRDPSQSDFFAVGQLQQTKGSKIHSSTPDVNLLFSLFSVLEQPGEEGSATSPGGGDASSAAAAAAGVHGGGHYDGAPGATAAGSSIPRPNSALNPALNLIVQGTQSPVGKAFPPLLNDVQLMQYSAMSGSSGMSPMSEGFAQPMPSSSSHHHQHQQMPMSMASHQQQRQANSSLRHRAHGAPTINTSLLPSHPFAPMLHGSSALDPLGSGMMMMSPMSPHTHHQMVAAQMMMHDELLGAQGMTVTPTFGLFSPVGSSGQPPSAGFAEQTSLLNELVERLS